MHRERERERERDCRLLTADCRLQIGSCWYSFAIAGTSSNTKYQLLIHSTTNYCTNSEPISTAIRGAGPSPGLPAT